MENLLEQTTMPSADTTDYEATEARMYHSFYLIVLFIR